MANYLGIGWRSDRRATQHACAVAPPPVGLTTYLMRQPVPKPAAEPLLQTKPRRPPISPSAISPSAAPAGD